jgi:hypothetical protein
MDKDAYVKDHSLGAQGLVTPTAFICKENKPNVDKLTTLGDRSVPAGKNL